MFSVLMLLGRNPPALYCTCFSLFCCSCCYHIGPIYHQIDPNIYTCFENCVGVVLLYCAQLVGLAASMHRCILPQDYGGGSSGPYTCILQKMCGSSGQQASRGYKLSMLLNFNAFPTLPCHVSIFNGALMLPEYVSILKILDTFSWL